MAALSLIALCALSAVLATIQDKRLPNVERLDKEMNALGLGMGTLDAAVTALNFHDIVNGRGREEAAKFLATVPVPKLESTLYNVLGQALGRVRFQTQNT